MSFEFLQAYKQTEPIALAPIIRCYGWCFAYSSVTDLMCTVLSSNIAFGTVCTFSCTTTNDQFLNSFFFYLKLDKKMDYMNFWGMEYINGYFCLKIIKLFYAILKWIIINCCKKFYKKGLISKISYCLEIHQRLEIWMKKKEKMLIYTTYIFLGKV